MPDELSAVSALYDIGRKNFGRPIEKYISWFNETLRLPVRFTVFLDPKIDPNLIALKPGDRIITIPIEEWYPMRWEARVDEIRLQSSNADLTFTMPRYSLLVMSKYDMLKRVAKEEGETCKMLWIDAGLSRFFRQDMGEGKLSLKKLDHLSDAMFAAPVTKFGIKQIQAKNTDSFVGSSPRLVTAGDMYATGAGAIDVAKRLYDMVEQNWLPNSKWDNEQVAMGCLIEQGWPGFKVAKVTSDFGPMLADLFQLRLHKRNLPGEIQRWIDKRTGAWANRD